MVCMAPCQWTNKPLPLHLHHPLGLEPKQPTKAFFDPCSNHHLLPHLQESLQHPESQRWRPWQGQCRSRSTFFVGSHTLKLWDDRWLSIFIASGAVSHFYNEHMCATSGNQWAHPSTGSGCKAMHNCFYSSPLNVQIHSQLNKAAYCKTHKLIVNS